MVTYFDITQLYLLQFVTVTVPESPPLGGFVDLGDLYVSRVASSNALILNSRIF